MANVRIELSDTYFINVDDLQYVLMCKKHGKSKENKPIVTEKSIGYYGDVAGALRQVAKMTTLDVLDGRTVSFAEYLKEYLTAESQLEKIIKTNIPRGLRKE